MRRFAEDDRPSQRSLWIQLCRIGTILLMLNLVGAARPAELRAAPGAVDAESAADVPFSLRPYRVRISVSTTQSAAARSFDHDRLLDELRQAVTRMYGRMWRPDVHAADWLRPGTPPQIAELEVPDLLDEDKPEDGLNRYPETVCDKAMFLGVAASTAGFEIICREYDTRTHDLSAARREFTPDRRQIATVAVRLIRDSFRPYLQYSRRYVDNDQQEFIQLQVQAGEIPAPDPTAEQVREGDVLRPFQRFMDRKDPTRLRQLRLLPLTYIRVVAVDEDITRGLTTGVLLTHAPASSFGMRGRNLQQIALRQRPVTRSSTIRLVERSVDSKPLICQRLSVVHKLRRNDHDELEQLQLVSDRNGEVTIPAHDDFPTLWLYVYSGEKLLAWIPYAPGLLPYDTVELPDDSIRLSVEGDLQLFEDELVDSIALREVQFSLARLAADEGRLQDLQQHLREYDANPTLDDLKKSLSLIRVSGTSRARRQGNRRAEQAVDRMCNRMLNTLNAFFADDRRRGRQNELDALRTQLATQLATQGAGT